MILGGLAALAQLTDDEAGFPASSEFHFLRLEYKDNSRFRRGRGWWMMDWPEADDHFAQGIRRLTRIDIGEGRHVPLTDDRVYEYPWIYATQVGFWDLSDAEVLRLRDYLLRGGFLMTDDSHGPMDWEAFRQTMERVFPGRPIYDMQPDEPALHVLYDIRERTTIPGLRHLRMGPGGTVTVRMQYSPPEWRGIYDDRGRMMVAINHNMDIGDAWEHADMAAYPAEMTGLAYRFGINYIVYAMTH